MFIIRMIIFSFCLFPIIKLTSTFENEKFEGTETAAKEKGGKFFDDPYLGAEKDADVYDTIEHKLTEVVLPKKENSYKEIKNFLPREARQKQKESAEHEYFKELATFNYGIIGMLKERLLTSNEWREQQELLNRKSDDAKRSSEEGNISSGKGNFDAVQNESRMEDDIYGEKNFFDDHLLANKGKEDNLDAVGWFE